MKERIRVNGMVTVRVLERDGNVKRRPAGWFRRVLGLKGRKMEQQFHNVVTRDGDALIADALLDSPKKPKVSGTSGFMQVGTGWTGTNAKNNTRCNAATGDYKALDGGYPAVKAAFGSNGDNAVMYRATFAAGMLNASGINEVCLLNGNSTNANSLAYAQINPAVNVTSNDTLQIAWEIYFYGV